MWVRLAVVALAACGAAPPTVVENRGGTHVTSCELPARLEFDARRYGNVDADSPDFQTWTAWRVGLQIVRADPPLGTLAMVGDELTWAFDVAGTHDDCTLALAADSHDPLSITIDLRTRTGRIRSIDDEWFLGPPFPGTRH